MIAEKNETIGKAVMELAVLSQDEKNRMIFEMHEKERMDRLAEKRYYMKQADEYAEKRANELAEKLANERANELAEKLANERANELAEKLANERAHELADKIADERAHELADKLANERAHELADKIADERVLKLTKRIFKLLKENKNPQEIAEICCIPLADVQEFID